MPLTEDIRRRLLTKLQQLYGDGAPSCLQRITELAARYEILQQPGRRELWDQRDVVLITYADQISRPGRSPLQTLKAFLIENRLDDLISTVHLLPFFPYSSDDGFSIIDYRQVDPRVGCWKDIGELGKSFDLMFDLVLNHCSQQHRWFQQYLARREPYVNYFVETDSQADLSNVTRPRNTPLLTAVETARGTRRVWTTFSDDQIDLNFAHPDVLIEMLDVLLFYVQQGARIIRLDAIAYLWKKPGTRCIHLPETHTVVKLMRDLLDALAPETILLTETNVPHDENVSYFGHEDEARMVYQFSLAPLLLDAFQTGDARWFLRWLSKLETTQPGTTLLNFTASHDGIGVRPLEGLVPAERIRRLVDATAARGGLVSTKRDADGSESPYELNISWFSALGNPEGLSREMHVRRFLASQAIMLALRGIPGIYFHSLVGTPNDVEGVERTGRARTINRRKFDHDRLQAVLAEEDSAQRAIFEGYRQMLTARMAQPAFHPDAEQEVCDTGELSVIAFWRTSIDQQQRILIVANLQDKTQQLDLCRLGDLRFTRDLLTKRMPASGPHIDLDPYQVAWLEARMV